MDTVHAPASRGAVVLVLGLLTTVDASASDRALEPFAFSGPAVVLSDLAGAEASTEALRGHVVLLHFFATWCEPCRPELASLNGLAAEKQGRGLKVLAVSVAEPKSRVERFFRANPVGFPVALDENRAAARAWGVGSLPSTIVLDRAGRPRLIARQDLDWGDAGVVRALEPLLAEAGDLPNNDKAKNGSEGGK